MSDYLIVGPTQRMLDVFLDVMNENQIYSNVYVKLIGNRKPIKIPSPFIVADNVTDLSDREMKVLCCSEEAIYWLSNNMGSDWELQFDPSYMKLLDKLSFKKFLVERGIPICKYWNQAEMIEMYPVVGKPSIGFASMGVRFLMDFDSCKAYEENFTKVMKDSVVEKYRHLYFTSVENKSLFEQEITGDFYRTSFVVKHKRCLDCFPVSGVTQSTSPGKQYSWIEFEYVHLQSDAYVRIKELLHRLTEVFELCDGVYVAEFMGTGSEKMFLLELSPRITSSRLVKLIEYATDINLDEVMVKAFLGVEFSCSPTSGKLVRLRIESKTDTFKPLSGYVQLTTCTETSAHGDDVDCKYFVKEGRK